MSCRASLSLLAAFRLRLLLPALVAVLGGVMPAQAQAQEFLEVRNIRVEGLQRITEGTVFSYLPVNIGDRLDAERVQEAVRAVFATGFFRDVEMRWDNGTLVLVVLERPSIDSLEITGNKDIKTEDLEEPLARIGLRQGRIFNQSVLDDVEQSLIDQYFSRGKYAAQVTTEIEELPDNRVGLTIRIREGQRARIRQINIVGNRSFTNKELLDRFSQRTPHLLSFIRQDDRYSREALSGDLEALRSFYMDRGFADFAIESTQVAISPDKQDIFITINIIEGERYQVSDVSLAGNLILSEEELRRFVLVQPGQTYSQQRISQSAEFIRMRLGEEGYAFASVEPVPELDRESKTVSLTLYVDPRNRVYVRRINFRGTASINDEVLRREMRQFEGGFLSSSRLERSRIRVQRLPYIDRVEVETNPVPGTPDLVDLDFEIEEGLPGQFGGGVGYSQSQKLLLNASIVHTNFFGTGNRVAADVNTGRFRTIYSASYTNPYSTINEVSRTISVAYRDITQFTSDASDFGTKTLSASVEYSYPLTEFQRLVLGFTWQDAELLSDANFGTLQSQLWVLNNGRGRSTPIGNNIIYTSKFDTYEVVGGWIFDSRNRALFADRGTRHRLLLSTTIPGISDVEYLTINYNFRQYIPIWRQFTLQLNADIGYGAALGDTTSLPPFRNYFAGGPDTVRGYRENFLGPKDSFGNPYGGDTLIAGQAELLLPMPDAWRNRARFSLFFDVGNVFSLGDVEFFDLDGSRLDYGFDVNELRTSVGIAAQWLAPLGLFRFSYGYPLNKRDGRPGSFDGDQSERFQFSIGGAF